MKYYKYSTYDENRAFILIYCDCEMIGLIVCYFNHLFMCKLCAKTLILLFLIATSSWLPPVASWITKKPGGNILEAKSWVSFSKNKWRFHEFFDENFTKKRTMNKTSWDKNRILNQQENRAYLTTTCLYGKLKIWKCDLGGKNARHTLPPIASNSAPTPNSPVKNLEI